MQDGRVMDLVRMGLASYGIPARQPCEIFCPCLLIQGSCFVDGGIKNPRPSYTVLAYESLADEDTDFTQQWSIRAILNYMGITV